VAKAVVGLDCFNQAVELGTLPRPFLSPSVAWQASAVAAAEAHGQSSARVACAELTEGLDGNFVDINASSDPSSVIATSSLDAIKALSDMLPFASFYSLV